jgi:hypothetical protein
MTAYHKKESFDVQEKEVVKASGAVHISHTVSLLQQQLWNILLVHAYSNFGKQNEFQLKISKILDYLTLNRQCEWSHVVSALYGLNVKVQYNLLSKDKDNKWGIFHLLQDVYVKNGVCFYSYDPTIKDAMRNSIMFAKISLTIQRKFLCKYALFLYELAVDYKQLGQTPWMELSTFRKYMGLQDDEYLTFKLFNFHVIKKAVEEVNQKSDLRLGVRFDRLARNIKGLQFVIEQLERVSLQQKESSLPLLPITENQVLLNKLQSYGLAIKKAKKVVEIFSPDTIEEKLRMMLAYKPKIKNTGAWLLKALSEDWRVIEYDNITEKERVRKELVKKRQREEDLKKKLNNLQHEHDIYKNMRAEQLYKALPQSMISYVDESFKPWLAEQHKNAGIFALSENFYKKVFLVQFLVDKDEQDFIKWASNRGYRIEQCGESFQLLE